ncbi:MAG TPA: trehalose-phosphatase [Candidatus Omnitrophota bacterium]|nr:trehalose-phosphatase [Candidatus Omnitrophota bacterium]
MSEHFSKALPEILNLPISKKLVFCLDFDGTLAPIRRKPSHVKASAALLKFLKQAASLHSCKVAIVSGRQLKDLKRKLRVPGIILAGSHGLEWNIRADRDLSRFKKLKKLQNQWRPVLRRIKGVSIENKPFSFVVHYRRASRKQQEQVSGFFLKQSDDLARKGFEWTSAHKAYEIFESERGRKEHVSRDLMQRFRGARMIAAGDDVTDFEMLRHGNRFGWAATIGFKRRGIKYFAKGPGDFVRCLNRILAPRLRAVRATKKKSGDI